MKHKTKVRIQQENKFYDSSKCKFTVWGRTEFM
jgi:hypothetical protein